MYGWDEIGMGLLRLRFTDSHKVAVRGRRHFSPIKFSQRIWEEGIKIIARVLLLLGGRGEGVLPARSWWTDKNKMCGGESGQPIVAATSQQMMRKNKFSHDNSNEMNK